MGNDIVYKTSLSLINNGRLDQIEQQQHSLVAVQRLYIQEVSTGQELDKIFLLICTPGRTLIEQSIWM